MPVTDHTAYIRTVERTIPASETSWTWTDPTSFADEQEEEIEISDAAIAVATYLDTAPTGRAGIVSLPDGQALAWHETEGWQGLSFYGDATPLDLAVDATPDQVARVAARL